MAEPSAFLIVNSTPNPGKLDKVQEYISQIVPLLVSVGGEPPAQCQVLQQWDGTEGPKTIAVMRFPDAQAVQDTLASDGYAALDMLRREAFSRVDVMICAAR